MRKRLHIEIPLSYGHALVHVMRRYDSKKDIEPPENIQKLFDISPPQAIQEEFKWTA